MNNYWIKLYIEILNDPKMGKMPVWLWKRAIELFLLAGENGNDGLLQPVEDIAWRLRVSETSLVNSLRALSEFGVVHETLPGWVVSNFKARQAPSTSTQRVRAFRERNSLETNRSINETKEKKESEEEEHSSSVSASVSDSFLSSVSGSASKNISTSNLHNAIEMYEENFGPLKPSERKSINSDIEHYGDGWVCDALQEAVFSNAFNLRYVEAILRRWEMDGRDTPDCSTNKSDGTDYL